MGTSPQTAATATEGDGGRGMAGIVEKLAEWLALAGGATLVAIVILTMVSITGRAFIFAGLSAVPGDFELVEAGTALAVFCFLPWCQLRGGHISVDLLAGKLGNGLEFALALAWNLLMTAALGLIAWRLWFGMLDRLRYNETSFILQVPVWIFYAVCIPPVLVAVAASLLAAVRQAKGEAAPS